MERITYTAPNLMDWVAQLKAGAATVKVHFSGGAITSYGVTPAEYTTTNPFIQKVIEQSQYFKEGRIEIGRRVQLPDSVKPKAKTQAQAVSAPEVTRTPVPTSEEPRAEVRPNDQSEDAADNITMIEVSCLQDAQDYLQHNFGISSYKVRSNIAVQKAGAEHGVMFFGGGFSASAERQADDAAVVNMDASESENAESEE